MFDELKEVKYFKEIKRLKSLQKEEAYFEPKRAAGMKLSCEYTIFSLLFSQYKLHHRLYICLLKY